MRILTVQQPWARAIIDGGKDVENRTRNIAGDYRGPVAIHAGKVYSPHGAEIMLQQGLVPNGWPDLLGSEWSESDWPRGAIIGVVDLVAAHSAQNCRGRTVTDQLSASHFRGYHLPTCTPWAELNGWHLELANPRSLAEPIPYRGALGLRTLPTDITARILRALGEPA